MTNKATKVIDYHDYLDQIKRNSAFEHAQIVWIHIILHKRSLSSGHLLSAETFDSIQRVCLQTAKAQIKLCMRAVYSGPSLSADDPKIHFRLVGLISYVGWGLFFVYVLVLIKLGIIR